MWFIMSLRIGLLLIFLHAPRTQSVAEKLDIKTLGRIIHFFEQNYKRVDPDGYPRQYATAINVPKTQCQKNFFPSHNNFLTQENAKDVKNVIGDQTRGVYKGKQLIAAGNVKKENYYIHSEFLLLRTDNISPMKHLLDTNKENCSIFYTFNSPCTGTCLNKKNMYNIFIALEEWSRHSGIKAFVFGRFWSKDKKKDLQSRFKQIAKIVPLYRCVSEEVCYACKGEENTPIDENCLPPQATTKSEL